MRSSARFVLRLFAVLTILAAGPSVTMIGLLSVSSDAQAQSGRTIQSIDVRGNTRVEKQTVVSYLRLNVGDRYDSLRADESFKALFATGLFSDVRIFMERTILVVSVTENPVINRVAFEGNRKVKDKTFAQEVESRARVVFTRARVQADVQRILTIYRRSGRFGARVEPKVIQLPQNRVDLVFEIDEGDKTEVTRINFIGNHAFSDKTLREEITTRESGLLSFLKTNDVYDPDRLAADQELLRRFYLNNGYADFRIISAVADLDRENNAFFITITIDEGPLYTFGDVSIESDVRELDPNELEGFVLTRPGDDYSLQALDKTLEDLTLAVSRLGFAFAQVRPRGDRDPVTQTISVVYVVEEGARVYIERINITGNTRTHDEVVRREFDMVEGDPYNRVLIDRAERRLNALGFFERVVISRAPGSAPDRVVVNVLVEDKPTGNFAIGAGFSTDDGILGDVSITERNLLGRGQFVRIAVALSSKRTDFDFSFTEPYFMNRRVSAGIDLFSRDLDLSDESSFSQKRVGGGVRFGFPLTESWSVTTRYQFSQEEIYDVQVGASIGIIQAIGKSYLSTAGYTFQFDTLDNRRDPRNGILFTFSQDIAGLGGDISYFRTVAEGRAYHDFGHDIVGFVRLEGGYVEGFGGDSIRVIDAFFKGGETIRGFDRAGIGPRDANTGDALGAKVFAAASAEVQFPILGLSEDLGFRGAAFVDAGMAYDTDLITGTTFDRNLDGVIAGTGETLSINDSSKLRSSVGLSLLWNSPVGPLRADVAHVLSSASFDDEQFFRFGGSSAF